MKKLNLTFLEQPLISAATDPIERMLHEFGQQIYEYARGYFNYIVTTTSSDDIVSEAALYIFVPEIGYDYRILSVSYDDVENVTVRFYTLRTKQTEEATINIKSGLEVLYEKVNELLSTKLANETYRFLVEQVNLKRENKEGSDEQED